MEEKPVGDVIRELITSFTDLMRSEIRLARVELTQNVQTIGKHLGSAVVFGVLAWLGVQALIAFLVIGLGDLFNGNYWLSALIVGLALVIPGAVLAMKAVNRIKNVTALPTVVRTIHTDRDVVSDKIQNLAENVRKRAS